MEIEKCFEAGTKAFQPDQRLQARKAFDHMLYEEFLGTTRVGEGFDGPGAAARAAELVGLDPSAGPKLWQGYQAVAEGIKALPQAEGPMAFVDPDRSSRDDPLEVISEARASEPSSRPDMSFDDPVRDDRIQARGLTDRLGDAEKATDGDIEGNGGE
jgi:hypothetical protein